MEERGGWRGLLRSSPTQHLYATRRARDDSSFRVSSCKGGVKLWRDTHTTRAAAFAWAGEMSARRPFLFASLCHPPCVEYVGRAACVYACPML